jgi:DNA replication protein DnaC
MPAIARSEPFREQVCPLGVCDGSGWILGPEDVARPCECRAERMKRKKTRGLTSTIPPKYRGVSFDRPPVTHLPDTVVHRVKTYIRELEKNLGEGKGLWFLGDVGTGKTTLAMLVSKTALERGHSVAIYSMPKLLARIRQTYDGDGDSYTAFFDRLTSVDLLHIDDVGAERQTEWVIEQLYSIVNERYESERSITFTTNSALLEEEDKKKRQTIGKDDRPAEVLVEKQIGRRTFSRLLEMCGDPIFLDGVDRRSAPRAAQPTP